MERRRAYPCIARMKRLLLAVFLAAGQAACVSPSAVQCGPASALTLDPRSTDLTGAPLGPLLVRGPYGKSNDARVFGFIEGRPTKMLLLVAQEMESDIFLTGVRCVDGQPLRFHINKGALWIFGPTSTPVPDDVMASTGDLRAYVPKTDLRAYSGSLAFGGYMLFPSTGAYRVDAFADERHIGSVVVFVTSDPLNE
jgi:hypothetical protein